MTEKSKRWRNHLIPDVFYEYDSEWYNVFHFDKKWIHAITWNKYDEEWFNQYWYSESWIDRNWFNAEGVHQITKDYFDQYWLDEYGFDKNWKFSIPNPHYPNSPLIPFDSDSNIYWYERDLFCEFSSIWIHKLTKTHYNEYGVDYKWCNNQWEYIWNKKCWTIINQIRKLRKDSDDFSKNLKDNESKLNGQEKELNLLRLKEKKYINEISELYVKKENYEMKYKAFISDLLDFQENYFDNHKKELDELRKKNKNYDKHVNTHEEIKERENKASWLQIETLKNKSFSDYPQIKKIASEMSDNISMQVADSLIFFSTSLWYASWEKIFLTKKENTDFFNILKSWKNLDIKQYQEVKKNLEKLEKDVESIKEEKSNLEWKIQKLEWVIKNLKNKIKELKNESIELEWKLKTEQNICKEKLNPLFEV